MKFYLSIFVVVMMFASCSSKYKLFQEDREELTDSHSESRSPGFLQKIFPKEERSITPVRSSSDSYPLNFRYQNKILPGDTLRIDVYNRSRRISLDTIYAYIDGSSEGLQTTASEKEKLIVDSDGTLFLPILNDVRFQGLTEKQASELLTQSYRAYLTDPYIKVQISNKRVYVLGEVNKPGMLPIDASSVSLYEIIAKSGDMTDFAKRDSIQIISGPLGAQKARIIDLTKMSSLNAADLMVPANSIIYIQPRYMKSVKVAVEDFSPILRVLTTTLSTFISIDYLTDKSN